MATTWGIEYISEFYTGIDGAATNVEVTSNPIYIGSPSHILIFLRHTNSTASLLEVTYEVSLDAATWAPLQIENVLGGVNTHEDRVDRKTIGGDTNWGITLENVQSPWIRVKIQSDGDANDTVGLRIGIGRFA